MDNNKIFVAETVLVVGSSFLSLGQRLFHFLQSWVFLWTVWWKCHFTWTFLTSLKMVCLQSSGIWQFDSPVLSPADVHEDYRVKLPQITLSISANEDPEYENDCFPKLPLQFYFYSCWVTFVNITPLLAFKAPHTVRTREVNED